MEAFSIQTIAALVEVVTGGPAGASGSPPIGLYRSGPELEQFLEGAGIELKIGGCSRVPAVRDALASANKDPESRGAVVRLLEQVADPREYLKKPEKTAAVIDYLNARLGLDGFELREELGRCKLRTLAGALPVLSGLRETATALNLDSVKRDFDSALSRAESDPEGAITAASSTIESVFKSILDDLGRHSPAKEDIDGLAKEVEAQLDLSPARPYLDPDLKRILGGLANVVRGIGALRTHGGDAHGRGKGTKPIAGRVARLAIHAASTVALFYIESWQESRQRDESR